MSKADEMGESAAFGRVGNRLSARGRSKDQAFNNDGPTVLALHLLSHNPDNPREDIGDVTELSNSLRDHKQKQPLAIMTRGAYLEANPGREGELEANAEYVVIDGNRRLAAARDAGLKSLKVMLDDEGLGKDGNEILESALVANVFNQKLEPLDEAKALKTLLEIHGTQDALAARLHRSQGWISQRLSLLDLKPDLQERLKAGKESASHLRRVGKKPSEEQDAALAAIKAKEAREKEERAARARAKAQAKEQAAAKPKGEPPNPSDREPADGAMNGEGGHADEARGDGKDHYGVIKESSDDSTTRIKEGASATGSAGGGQAVAPSLPFHDVSAMARIISEGMELEDVRRLVKTLWATHGD
ncbi:ParB/RepB/Spo0J family partition protein [Streptomyces nigrescens]